MTIVPDFQVYGSPLRLYCVEYRDKITRGTGRGRKRDIQDGRFPLIDHDLFGSKKTNKQTNNQKIEGLFVLKKFPE